MSTNINQLSTGQLTTIGDAPNGSIFIRTRDGLVFAKPIYPDANVPEGNVQVIILSRMEIGSTYHGDEAIVCPSASIELNVLPPCPA